MEYLTAKEFSQKWNISSRMVAYYCKAGKIAGAVKKGKTWLLPAHAEKPPDGRFTGNRIVVADNPGLQGELQKINRMDSENDLIYHANDLYKNLGLTRETLRYYEEIGLITPERSRDSQYREFTFADVSRLLAIDFYKKRGFTPREIREKSEECGETELLDRKIGELENNIRMQQRIVERLTVTRAYCEYAARFENTFTIKELPLYRVMETFDAVSSLHEYEERVLASLNLQEEDILSNLVRVVTFDSSGYKGTKMCTVRQAVRKGQSKENRYLESGKCLHTVVKADSHDDSLMEKMFSACYQWANGHGEYFVGVVYIFIRFVELSRQSERNIYEIWLPLK